MTVSTRGRNIVNWAMHIVGAAVGGWSAAWVFWAGLVQYGAVRKVVGITNVGALVAVLGLVMIALVWWRGAAHRLWRRYRNTHRLREPPCTYVDDAVLFALFCGAFLLVGREGIVVRQSLEFSIFMAVLGSGLGVWFVATYFWRGMGSGSVQAPGERDWLTDEPISCREQDLFERGRFVQGLRKEIVSLPFENSFVFGLYGSWGEGKTSVMNLLREEISGSGEFLILDFDPWYYKNEEGVLVAFYKQVEEAMSREFLLPGLRTAITRYVRMVSVGIEGLGARLDIAVAEESLQATRKRIEAYVSQTSKKLLVLVDNTDRLERAEMLAVFKLVRLHASFRNTVFVLSLDPAVVVGQLNEEGYEGWAFLEKIVQKQVSLPSVDQDEIDGFVSRHLDKIFKEVGVPEEKTREFGNELTVVYQNLARRLFVTLRDAKRLLNGLRSRLPVLSREVNLCDFFILELIRVFYPRVFDDIWRNPWFYVPQWGPSIFLRSPLSSTLEGEERYEKIKKHIQEISSDEKQSDVLLGLLRKVFFVEVENAFASTTTGHDSMARDYRVRQRVTHPDVFATYFMLRVPSAEISDEYIQATLDAWAGTQDEERAQVVGETLVSASAGGSPGKLLKKLMLFRERIPAALAGDMVRAIYRKAKVFSFSGGDLWSSEFYMAESLLLQLVDEKIEGGRIQAVIEEVVKETPSVPFAVHVVHSCMRSRERSFHNMHDAVELGDLQQIVSQRLEHYYVVENRDILDELPDGEWSFVLGQWVSNWERFTGDARRVGNAYLFGILEGSPKKLGRFLTCWRSWIVPREGWTFKLAEIERWYDVAELLRLAREFSGADSLSEAEGESIVKFIEVCEAERVGA